MRELELLGGLARDLGRDERAVGEQELDAHLEAEVDDALDHRLAVVVAGLEREVDVVRTHELVADGRHRADEAHHELVRRVVVDLARIARLLDARVVHDHDLVGDVHRLLLIVGDEDRRHVLLLVQAAQPDAQLLAHGRVERAERLVEQQHAGLDRERAGERHALALATGELRGIALGEAAQLHEREQLLDTLADLGLRALADLEAEGDVACDGHVLERGVVLEHEADAALLRHDVRDVAIADQDLTGVRRRGRR